MSQLQPSRTIHLNAELSDVRFQPPALPQSSDLNEQVANALPAEMREIAKQILYTRVLLSTLEIQYGILAVHWFEKTTRENKEKDRIEREKAQSKRDAEARIKEARKLRGIDKKMYKKTGQLPKEIEKELIEKFKEFLEAQKNA